MRDGVWQDEDPFIVITANAIDDFIDKLNLICRTGKTVAAERKCAPTTGEIEGANAVRKAEA
jgi:hypothetical protein